MLSLYPRAPREAVSEMELSTQARLGVCSWLTASALARWKQGRVEGAVSCDVVSLTGILKLAWPSEVSYVMVRGQAFKPLCLSAI